MRYFLDDLFDVKYLDMIANIKSDEYYINMTAAWYFATAIAKQYHSTVAVLHEKSSINGYITKPFQRQERVIE